MPASGLPLTIGESVLIAIITSVFHLLLPLAWLGVLAVRTPRSWVVRALNLTGSALLVGLLVYLGAGWALLGWYTRWALLVVAAPLWLLAAARVRGALPWPRGLGGWASAAGALLVALLLVASSLQVAVGSNAAALAPVDVQNPLPVGAYLVLHGGDSEAMNHHASVPAQRHALDIVGLSGGGFRAASLAPTDLADYVIYGATLRAPCAGEVLLARDGLGDLPAGLPGEAGHEAPLGNTVLIHCTSDITVVLAHLRPHSVRVATGDVVALGRELGAVGNSGNSSEPHLHLHAVRGRVADPVRAITDAEPVPLRIDGVLPVRNDRLVVPEAVQPSRASS